MTELGARQQPQVGEERPDQRIPPGVQLVVVGGVDAVGVDQGVVVGALEWVSPAEAAQAADPG